MFASLLAVILGGSIGCVLRWVLGIKMNSIFPHLPLGTLCANLFGGLIIGAAMAYFIKNPTVDPNVRLLVMTGFCGGFTTFSTFSAEVLMMLQDGRLGWAAATITAHIAGSLLMTFVGYAIASTIDW